MAHLKLLLVVFFLSLFQVVSLNHPEIAKSFHISQADEATQYIRLTSLKGSVATCEFQYITRLSGQAKQAQQQKDSQQANIQQQQQQQQSLQTVFNRLSGVCIRKTIAYWKYEICFEGQITQSHGRISNILGVYSNIVDNNQLYADGSVCEALFDNTGRKCTVEFVCDMELHLISIDEVATCSYKAVVGTPLVCGNPLFRGPSQVKDDSGHQLKQENWFMELVEMDEGQLTCSVYSVADLEKQGAGDVELTPYTSARWEADTLLHFESFDLSLRTDSGTLTPEFHTVRQPGRRRLASDEYQMQHINGDSKLLLKQTDAFEGRLEYLLIQAVND